MSLHLADQKLGSHSGAESSSHKFMLKGRQTGGVHRGHAWVFRAESYDTMLAWFEDIKSLTEKTGEERTAFIRQHARSISAGSNKAASVSDDGALDEDEADQVPYSAAASQIDQPLQEEKRAERPVPGGRFPSALTIDRNSQVPLVPSSPSSSGDRDIVATAGSLPGSGVPFRESGHQVQSGEDQTNARGELSGPSGPELQGFSGPGNAAPVSVEAATQQNTYKPTAQTHEYNGLPVHPGSVPFDAAGSEYNTRPVQAGGISSDGPGAVSYGTSPSQVEHSSSAPRFVPPRHDSKYGDWMGPSAAGVGGLAAGAAGVEAYKRHQQKKNEAEQKTLEENELNQDPKAYIETNNDLNQGQSGLSKEQNNTQASPATFAPVETFHQKSSSAGVTAPGGSPTSRSTQPIPQNAAWAPSTASVIDPTQIYNDDITPTRVGNVNPFSTVIPELSPVAERSTSIESGNRQDPAAPIKALARPALESHASVITISDLHIPGEYPKTKPEFGAEGV